MFLVRGMTLIQRSFIVQVNLVFCWLVVELALWELWDLGMMCAILLLPILDGSSLPKMTQMTTMAPPIMIKTCNKDGTPLGMGQSSA